MDVKTKRIFALIIDLLIIATISTLFSGLFNIEKELGTFTVFEQSFVYGINWSVLFYLMYFITFDVFGNSVTIGKQFMKIKFVAINNEELTLKLRIKRSVLKTISLLFLPISAVVFLLNGFSLEDKFCNTNTIEELHSFSN